MAQISLNSLMNKSLAPTYSEEIAAPFRQELTEAGFEQLMTPEEVEKALNKKDGKTHIGCVELSLWLRCKSSKAGCFVIII